METGVHIRFLVDEHLPVRQLIPLLGNRGHQAASVELRTGNPVILKLAEETGAVVITADRWFLEELLQYPRGHPDCYTRAGVIQVPGTWAATRPRLTTYLPVIEYLVEVRRARDDQHFAMNLSRREIRIYES